MKPSIRTGLHIYSELVIATNQISDLYEALQEVEKALGKESKAYLLLEQEWKEKKREFDRLSGKQYTEQVGLLPASPYPPNPNELRALPNGI